MRHAVSGRSVAATRMAAVARYAREIESAGAPVQRMLGRAGIRPDMLGVPELAVPLRSAFRFVELACRALGTEHLGLRVGLSASLADLGPYGYRLQHAVTVHDYLRRGIALFNMLMTGQRFWLSEQGEELRLNLTTDCDSGIGPYQSHVESLAITIARLREAAGADWSPREISFAYRSREPLPDTDLFAGSRVLRGTGETYLTIPRVLLGLPFPASGDAPPPKPDVISAAVRPLPEHLAELVQLQIGSLLSDRTTDIDTVAETLAMSRRSLQRGLAEAGLSYSALLTEVRMQRAADWLATATERSISAIAFDLGYADAANFSRAFRRQTGVSPRAFREMAGRSGSG